MSIYSGQLLEKTITVWQPFSSSVLSEKEAKEITESIVGLFSFLLEWENKDEDKNENNKEKE